MLQLASVTISPPSQSLLSACLLSRLPSGRGGRVRRVLGSGGGGAPGVGGPGQWAAVLWAVTPYPSPHPPFAYIVWAVSFLAGSPLPRCPAPDVALRTGRALAMVCFCGFWGYTLLLHFPPFLLSPVLL